MTNEHLTELQFQQYAFEKENCESSIVEHVERCDSCKTRVRTYREIFNAVKQIEKPAFDNNLTELVLGQLSKPKRKFFRKNVLDYSMILSLVAAVSFLIYLFRPFLTRLFDDAGSLTFYTLVISGLTITGFQALEAYNRFQRKINRLNFY